MFLNLLVFVLLIMITLYLSTQGMLSSLLALATSIFSSILAMALFEPLQNIIGGWRPDYGRGVTFLLLFFLTFSLTRIIADMVVPKNIKLTLWQNRIAGGVIGFFVSLVVVGTLVIGIEMLPIGRTPLGFERFPPGPDAPYLQKLDENSKPILGEVATPHNIWFAPDRFVLAIWNGASGRSLGGGRAFSTIHPDLPTEMYAYRSQVPDTSRTLPADLLEVTAGWKDSSYTWTVKDETGKDQVKTYTPKSGNVLVMIRTEIKGPEVRGAYDTDGYYRAAASQVRLITSANNKGAQYFPIGYLEAGKELVTFALDNGYVMDELKDDKTVDDWIFEIPADQKPVAIEVKQLARRDVTLQEHTDVKLAKAYPRKTYLKERSTFEITFNPKSSHDFKSGAVIVLRSNIIVKNLATSDITKANGYINEVETKMGTNTNGWSDSGSPGIPGRGDITGAKRAAQDILNGTEDTPVNWYGLTPLLLLAKCQPDGPQNIVNVPAYFNSGFKAYLRSPKSGAPFIEAEGVPDKDNPGRVKVDKVSKGQHTVIFAMTVAKDGVDRGFYLWVKDIEFGKEIGKNKDGSPKLEQLSLKEQLNETDNVIFHLDLDDKKN